MTRAERRSILAALGAALLFGAGTPAAKPLLGVTDPWLMAGLLYSGSGIGLLAFRLSTGRQRPRLQGSGLGWLAGAIACGGVPAPILRMQGLSRMPSSCASLAAKLQGT